MITNFLMGLMLAVIIFLAALAAARTHPRPTIGGTAVSYSLHCQEDEVIGFVGTNKLGCVNIELIMRTR